MRFKPRTDLERIYDSVNLNYYGKIDQGVINRQLKQLDLNVPKASLSCDINDDDNNKTLNNNKVGNADFPSHLSPVQIIILLININKYMKLYNKIYKKSSQTKF